MEAELQSCSVSAIGLETLDAEPGGTDFTAQHIRCYFRTQTLMEDMRSVCEMTGYTSHAVSCEFCDVARPGSRAAFRPATPDPVAIC